MTLITVSGASTATNSTAAEPRTPTDGAPEFDVVIVGGGPAGLSAALTGGRSRRKVLLVDGGVPRNAQAPAVHTFLTRDGIKPAELRRISREQIAVYPTVTFREGRVEGITSERNQFTVLFRDGSPVRSRFVLLAVGLIDELPAIEGLKESWGAGVHHCVYCDGYEGRDERWGVLAEQPAVFDHALFMRGWTSQITVFTNGGNAPSAEVLAKLAEAGIPVEGRRIARVQRGESGLKAIVLQDGTEVPVRTFWIRPKQHQTALVKTLNLALLENGAVQRSEEGETSVPGIFAAGDLSAGPMQQAIGAAADGSKTFAAMNRRLAGH